MGIVDYAATTCLAVSGAALAAPFIEAKVPAAQGALRQLAQFRKFVGLFGIFGGALGLIAVPLVLVLAVGVAGLLATLPLLIVALLELLGCAGTILLGVMVLRTPATDQPHDGQLDLPTGLGLGGVAYGGFLFLVLTVLNVIY